MFGSLGAFVNGNMFAGLFGEDVGVKLDSGRARGAEGAAGQRTVRSGRPRRWVATSRCPPDLDDAAMTAWVDRARDHVATLPPKVKKPKT